MKLVYKILFLFTLFCYLSVFVSPETFWMAGFASFLIPTLLLLHLSLLILNIIRNKKTYVYPLLALLFGIPFLLQTLTFHIEKEKSNLTVLSYNTRVFNVYKHLNTNFISSKKMMEWVINDTSDIKCFQEYYNDPTSKLFTTTVKIRDEGYYSFHKPLLVNKIGAEFGLAIFTKHKIIKKGVVDFKRGRNKFAIFVDVQFNEDTLRIYNVHLESMSIDQNSITDAEKFQNTYIDLFHRLKRGMITRSLQADELVEHMQHCPYKIIMCGDLNELPYSYTYYKFKNTLSNSFESAGNGFGFSFNGKLPFLRIDNQFYGEGIEISDYETLDKVSYSDHFPVKAKYFVNE